MIFSWKRCGVTYSGPSAPGAHGAKCELPHGHDQQPPSRTWSMKDPARHWGWHPEGGPLGWYSDEQKKA